MREVHLNGAYCVYILIMEDYWNNAKSAIFCNWVSWLEHIIAGQLVLHIEVAVKYVVGFSLA